MNQAKNRVKFWFILLLMVSGRAFDITTTYLYTPDLAHETNIVVNSFHMNIAASIMFQFAVLCIVTYFLYVNCFKKVTIEPGWGKMLFASDRITSLYTLGYIIPRSLIVISFIVGTSTTFLILSPAYKELYRHGGSIALYVICVVTIIFYTMRFYRVNQSHKVHENSSRI
jgi:hypothetical protein